MRSVPRFIESDLSYPIVDDARILPRRQVCRSKNPARKKIVAGAQRSLANPEVDGKPRLLGNLELYRPLRLLLHDRRAVGDALAANGNLAF